MAGEPSRLPCKEWGITMDMYEEKTPGGGDRAGAKKINSQDQYTEALSGPQEKTEVTNKTLAVALEYSKRGLCVFPCNGKTPSTVNGCRDASKVPSVIIGWWNKWPNANIGVATGPAYDLWVLDIDGFDGEENLARLEMEHGRLPQTVEVVTGGGGRHIWFRWPHGADIRNSAGRIASGIDVRGVGGYVISPPSRHNSGREYSWSVDSGEEILDAPEWLLKLVIAPKGEARAKPQDEWLKLMQGVGVGQRNDAIARLAGLLLRKHIDPYIALELCQAWNESRCNPSLPVKEVTHTVDSIARRELQRRAK